MLARIRSTSPTTGHFTCLDLLPPKREQLKQCQGLERCLIAADILQHRLGLAVLRDHQRRCAFAKFAMISALLALSQLIGLMRFSMLMVASGLKLVVLRTIGEIGYWPDTYEYSPPGRYARFSDVRATSKSRCATPTTL